jgi:WD40 repeat protein
MAGLVSEVCGEWNAIAMNSALHWVMAAGGVDGIVESWDLRERASVATITTGGNEVTAITFDSNGLLMGVGHSDGLVQIYDVRFPNTLYDIQHHYNLPIK